MLVVKTKDVRKEWAGKLLFQNVSLEIHEGEHVALFGGNGTGKTTLLRGLTGRIPFDGGTVQRYVPLEQWGWLDQHVDIDPGQTALEFVQSGSPELFAAKRNLERWQASLNSPDGDSLEAKMARYSEAYERYMQLNGYDWEVKVEKCLQRMKLDSSLCGLPFASLSGGQKTRAQLARLMAGEPKFILLDEPTNHLDSETLDWLEQWIRAYEGTVLLVSHDRYFLDRAAHSVYELSPSGGKKYTGGYTDYRRQKELELRTQEALYKKQEQERRELLESIRRYQQWFQQAHRAAGQNDFYRSKAKKNVSRFKAKETALEKLERERVEKPREAAKLKMTLEASEFAASTLLRMEGVGFAYADGRTLFQHLDLSVNRGDRIAVIGPNGAGKSTLLKLLVGCLAPAAGAVRTHPQAKIGYFAQELDNLEMKETILDSLLKLPDMTQALARTILGCFLFSRDDVFRTIGELSMGEKCRVAFLKLYFGRANLLVLDEPTNHLDIDTREKVEEALLEYPGALVVVSHDRYLIRKIANRLVILNGGEVVQFPGTYDQYFTPGSNYALTPDEQRRENELRRLELRLVRLMGEEEPEDVREKEKLMAQIREVRARIAELS